MTIKYVPRDFGGFPRSGDADSVSKCVAVARKKAKQGKPVTLWEEYLCKRFDEWRSWADKRHTIVKPEGGRVSFVAGKAPVPFGPEPTFTFEQILQTSLPLRALFNNGHETAKAAEELLRACHYRARANQQKARDKNEPKKYLPMVSFEEGSRHITGNQRDERAEERFSELMELEQAEAVFSGMFPEPWFFCDPTHPDRVEALFEGTRPSVAPPTEEVERYQAEGFTLDDVERLTLARNSYIQAGYIKGKPVTKLFEKKACVAEGDNKKPKADAHKKKADGLGKKSDKASVAKRQPKPKR
jgi:hypothetical protein